MPLALIRPGQRYAWRGPSLLVVNTRGECVDEESLSGYYFREARFLDVVLERLGEGGFLQCQLHLQLRAGQLLVGTISPAR